jgi:hypothetical protein
VLGTAGTTPTLSTQLGNTVSASYTGPTSGTALVNGAFTKYGERVVTQPGTYIVTATARISPGTALMKLAGIYLDVTGGATKGATNLHYVPFSAAGFALGGQIILPITSIVVLPTSVTTSTFALYVITEFAAGTSPSTVSSEFVLDITRIA